MKRNLTNIRTFVQFSQYGDVVQKTVCANKLRTLNIIKSVYGNVPISTLREYKTDGYLIEGSVLTV